MSKGDGATNGSQEDAETVQGYLGGEPVAVARVDSWIAGAAGPFRRRLAADWPDLQQDARIEILSLLRQSSWKGEARLKTYVWRVVGHTCLDALRRQKRRPLHEPADPEARLPSPEPSPADRLAERDQSRLLLAVLDSVPPDCRDLWQRILRGLSYAEIGREMGVSEGALRVRALRCRKRALEALGGNAPALRLAQR